jgi:hypothetical protein
MPSDVNAMKKTGQIAAGVDNMPACTAAWWVLQLMIQPRFSTELAVGTTPNECWMDLHRLAESLDGEGLTRQERFDNLVHEFLRMPPLVRRELLRELRFVLCEFTDLEPVVIQATNAAEEKKARPNKTA